jgi:hypothetical protein
MIFSDVYDLRQFVISNVEVNCEVGNIDTDPSSYPIVLILPDEEMTAHFMNMKATTLDMPVNLKIIVSQGNEIKAFEVLDRLIQKINQFKPHKGNMLDGTITPEYVEPRDTYEVSVQYNLKLLLQDTGV